MNHNATLQYISEAGKFSSDRSLGRVRELSRRLGDPWRGLNIFHIAGTNGKGSISSYLTHILSSAGHRVGWYTSPYLERFNERIRVIQAAEGLEQYDHDNEAGEIDNESIDRIMARVSRAADSMQEDGIMDLPSEFDLITMMAFIYFKEKNCDYVVLESGLGGRLDSTNVIENPLASIIAAPGYDHMDRLGNSMRNIMYEKAGIIKPGTPVFAYDPFDAMISEEDAVIARKTLEERCLELDVPLHWIGRDQFEMLSYSRQGQSFRKLDTEEIYTTKLLGVFQPINALLAASALANCVSAEDIRQGIAATVWPARLEILSHSPFVLLDGAHNIQGCHALVESLAQLNENTPLVFLCAIMQDKNYREMLSIVLNSKQYESAAIVFTAAPDERTASAEEMLATAKEVLDPETAAQIQMCSVGDYSEALDKALALAEEKGALLCIFGSLYLAGAIRKRMRELQK
ncbi:MAG: bifunctional folylpolyglutamate synthase/dihydrofolate synthase [Clostridiaceae bacterium]|jgi:dihydrofolate synthase/folylpolyglutamate synthase|nr:bifunctional folylpolyglutamate synthase/dihydrofolate synthase [Clostridiaceae bacterium]